MSGPDPERLGGLAWTRRTRGELTSSERRRLLGEIVRAQAGYVAGRVRLLTGRTPEGARDLALSDFTPPDSRIARVAEEACREQPPEVIGHSYRTWVFGNALAALDAEPLEPELFYVASLLHDYGLAEAVAGEDFTLRSVARAERCASEVGAPSEAAESIGDAITVHTTPGIATERDGALGIYVQSGAMCDLAGLRAADLTREFRDAAAAAHPRGRTKREIPRMIRAEARANPKGRFGLLHRCGLNALIRVAPR